MRIQHEFPFRLHALLVRQPFLKLNQEILSGDRVSLALIETGCAEWDRMPKKLTDIRTDQFTLRFATKHRDRVQLLDYRRSDRTRKRVQILWSFGNQRMR